MSCHPRLVRAAEMLEEARDLRERAEELVSEAFALIAEHRHLRERQHGQLREGNGDAS